MQTVLNDSKLLGFGRCPSCEEFVLHPEKLLISELET
jgi:hypothetical protein